MIFWKNTEIEMHESIMYLVKKLGKDRDWAKILKSG